MSMQSGLCNHRVVYVLQVNLPNLTNKNRECTVKFKFQVSNADFCFSITAAHAILYLGLAYPSVLVVCLKFKFSWSPVISFGNL